jgi:protein TonB
MNTLPSLTPPSRPIPLLALALGVLLAHALLLAWLVFTPTQAPNKPEQRIEWVTLQKAPLPAVKPPAPPQPAHQPTAAVPPPEKKQPAPPQKHFARPAPPHPTPQTPPAPHRPQPPKPVLPRAETPQIEPTAVQAPSAPDLLAKAAAPTVAPGPPHPAAAASAPPEPVVETAASYKAEYLDNPPPPYPRLSRQLGEEGTALLKVQVGPNGRPLQIKLMSSTGYPRLDEAAEATVAQWRFVAATRNGQSVTSWVLVPIKFRILN